jgi:Matrixin
LKALFAGLVALLCCALGGTAEAQEAGVFKILKLEGNQVRWRVPRNSAPLVVTFRIATETSEFPGARNCRKLTGFDDLIKKSGIGAAALKAELAAAFAMWEAAANITFQEAPEGVRADILIGAQSEPEGWAFADVFYDLASAEPIKPISRALVCLNPLRGWKIGFDGDLHKYDLRYTFAHEIGHAIGLDHPNGGDQIMGYRYEERFRSLQPGDVRGAVALYGAAPHVELTRPETGPKGAQASSSTRRFAKRWGTRGFTARSP